MRGSEAWLAAGAWLVVGCLAFPMEMKKDAPPTSLYRVSGSKGYEFEYKVVDSEAAWVHSRDEWSDGEFTRGSYTVKLPDGRIQKVTFTADDDGYHPVITYEPAAGDEEGGGGGVDGVPDGIGASRGSWYTVPHVLGLSGDWGNIRHPEARLTGLGVDVVMQPPHHDLWGPTPQPHHLYDPLRLTDEDFSLYDPLYPYEYYYQPPPALPPLPPPPPRRDPQHPLYKAPIYLPATANSRATDDHRDMTMKHKPEESSEESGADGDDDDEMYHYLKTKNLKPKTAIYVKEKSKAYLGGGKKRPTDEQSMESDGQSYERETVDTRPKVKNRKEESLNYGSSGEEEESNESEAKKSDRYEMKHDSKLKYEEAEEIETEQEGTGRANTREYGRVHSMSAHHKKMDEYLRKIKRVMARFEKPRPPHFHRQQALYRHHTTKMVTPRRWVPQKTGEAASSEREKHELEEKPLEMNVKMTPPDKPFYKPISMDVKMTPPDRPFYKAIKMDVRMTPPDKPFYKPIKMDVKMTPPDKPFNTNKPRLKGVRNATPKKMSHKSPKMNVKMTPPDKPFYIPKHRPHSPLPPLPPHPTPPIRKHSLQRKHRKGLQESVFNISAPMLHAPPPPPPPPPPPRTHIIRFRPSIPPPSPQRPLLAL